MQLKLSLMEVKDACILLMIVWSQFEYKDHISS